MLSDKATVCFSQRIGSKRVQHQNCAGWRSTRSSPRLFILWLQLSSMVFSVHQDVALATCPRCVAECCRYWLYLIIAYTDYIWLYWLNGRSFTNDPVISCAYLFCLWMAEVCLFCCRGRRRRNTRQGKQLRSRWVKYCIFIFTLYTIYIYHYIILNIETRGLKAKSQSRWFLNMPPSMAPRLWLSNDFP